MKASDFTTGGNDREKAMSNLLKTEKTDAVNTGLVEKADKSAKALKGDLYSVGKKGTHGAGSTALDAIARKRKKTSAADALDGKSRSQLTGKNALTKKVQSRHNLNKSLKTWCKGCSRKSCPQRSQRLRAGRHGRFGRNHAHRRETCRKGEKAPSFR